MKTEWICKWQLMPGGQKHTATYPSQSEAQKAMAKVLTDTVDLQKYIHALRNDEGEDCGSSAAFLEGFLSDLTMPELEFPDCCDVPDHCIFAFDSCDGFRWGYMRGECPYLSAGYVYEGKEIEPYVISFNFESPRSISRDRVTAVEIRIYEHVDYGTSAYPLMVLQALREYPQTQDRIARPIFETWNTGIDRKGSGRLLQLLQELGYPVQHKSEGYCCKGEPGTPKSGTKFTPSAYPLLVLKVLDATPKTQTAMIKQIQETFGTKIDRKAVVRHLELLEALFGFRIRKCKDGYFLET